MRRLNDRINNSARSRPNHNSGDVGFVSEPLLLPTAPNLCCPLVYCHILYKSSSRVSGSLQFRVLLSAPGRLFAIALDLHTLNSSTLVRVPYLVSFSTRKFCMVFFSGSDFLWEERELEAIRRYANTYTLLCRNNECNPRTCTWDSKGFFRSILDAIIRDVNGKDFVRGWSERLVWA